MNKRNAEGYYDPTAYEALTNVEQEEKRIKQLCKRIDSICADEDFRIKRKIILIDKRTGQRFTKNSTYRD